MDISIDAELAQFIGDQIRSGRFATADDVVNGALLHLRNAIELQSHAREKMKRDTPPGNEERNRRDVTPADPADIWADTEHRFAGRNHPDEQAVG